MRAERSQSWQTICFQPLQGGRKDLRKDFAERFANCGAWNAMETNLLGELLHANVHGCRSFRQYFFQFLHLCLVLVTDLLMISLLHSTRTNNRKRVDRCYPLVFHSFALHSNRHQKVEWCYSLVFNLWHAEQHSRTSGMVPSLGVQISAWQSNRQQNKMMILVITWRSDTCSMTHP